MTIPCLGLLGCEECQGLRKVPKIYNRIIVQVINGTTHSTVH